MRTHNFDHSMYMFLFLLFFRISVIAQTTDPFIGNWEGTFMGNFEAHISIKLENHKTYSGHILMYAGETQIQNDELSSIVISEDHISFIIMAKETKFDGKLEKDKLAFSGHFIFPDGSRHPISVKKTSTDMSVFSPESSMENINKDYSPEDLKADLQNLVDNLNKNHPQLFTYTTKAKFDENVKTAMDNIVEPMTIEEFFLLIAPIVDAVKCSHTGIRLPADYQKSHQQSGHLFPLDLFFTGEKAYYFKSLVHLDISPGAEIVSINDLPVKNMIRKLLPLFPAEGNNSTTKYNQLNQHFNSYYQLLGISEPYEIEFKSEGNIKTTIIEHIEVDASVLIPEREFPINFRLDSSNTGLLRISEFMFPDINKYIHLTDSIFQTIKDNSIDNLVLDLRDNPGGHPIFAAQLLSFLVDHDFTYFKPNPAAPEFEPLYNPMQSNKLRFDGNVYVLINGGCLSTTGHLISLLKYNTDALFIGEEPGSTLICNDLSQRIILPNTGIEVNIPRTTFETDVSGFEKNQAFPLDYQIETSVNDLAEGRDTYLDFVLNLIEQNQ